MKKIEKLINDGIAEAEQEAKRLGTNFRLEHLELWIDNRTSKYHAELRIASRNIAVFGRIFAFLQNSDVLYRDKHNIEMNIEPDKKSDEYHCIMSMELSISMDTPAINLADKLTSTFAEDVGWNTLTYGFLIRDNRVKLDWLDIGLVGSRGNLILMKDKMVKEKRGKTVELMAFRDWNELYFKMMGEKL